MTSENFEQVEIKKNVFKFQKTNIFNIFLGNVKNITSYNYLQTNKEAMITILIKSTNLKDPRLEKTDSYVYWSTLVELFFI